jgi:ribosomal-protein-serine acetyltransferase
MVPTDAGQRYALLAANRDASRWLSWITDADGPDPEYLEQNILVPIAGSRTVFGIFMDANLVGQIEFDPQDVSAEPGTASIGYLLDKKLRGQGIATRACAAVISYAFDEMKLKGIEIHCRPDNLPSVKLAKRLEFQGREPNDRLDGQLLFTMTSEIWRSSHQ